MINIIKYKNIAVIMLLFSTLQATSESINAQTPLAQVNGTNITLGHVIAAAARLPQEYDNLEPNYLLEGLLDQIVKQEVMAQTINLSKLLTQFSLENEIRSIKAKYAIEEKMQDFPTAKMIQGAYEEAMSTLQNIEEFNASHILLNTKANALETLKLLNSGADFSKLAKEKSTGPSGANGGQLGWFGLGQMVPEFETAVMVLEIGQVSQPVETQFGWHIIKLNDRRFKPLPTIEELRPELIQKLSQNHIDDLVKIKSEEATINFYDKSIDPTSIRNTNLLK